MIIPTNLNEQSNLRTAVTLEQYAKALSITECEIFGVDDVANREINDCREIWTLQQRNYILRYLSEAQIEFENETKMLFGSTWITGDITDTGNDRLTDIQTYRGRCRPQSMYTKWNNVVAVGRLVPVQLTLAEVVSHATDPTVTTIVVDPAVVLDVNKVRIFEAGNYGTDKEIAINASAISIVGVNMTIQIPRCRMVKYDLRDTPTAGLEYADTSNFIDSIDVYYYSTVNENSLVVASSNCVCGTTESNSCLEILTRGIAIVKAVDYCNSSCSCGGDLYGGLWYEAGDAAINQQQSDAIIRLAHSKMSAEPCGCDPIVNVWKRDREVPDFISPEREASNFGHSEGAFFAWKQARTMKKARFGTM